MRYTKANPYNMINVWADDSRREAIIKHKLLTDKSFKMTSLQENPVYKKIFDKLDALAKKELNELDKSVLWSRKYTKSDFKHFFVYPFIMFAVVIFCLINFGVKNRIYAQHIKHGRRIGLGDRMNLDLDDVENYPKAVFELYKEKQAYDIHIERKESKIKETEDKFKQYANQRLMDERELRKKRGLRVD